MPSYTKTAVKGTATVLIVSLFAAFLGYLVRLVLAKNLSVEDFGLFYATFAFLGIFGVFKTLGFDKALAKFIPEFMHQKEYGSVKSAIIYAAIIQLITNMIIITVIYLFSGYLSTNFFHSAKAGIALRLMVISVSIDSFVQVIRFSLQGFRKMAYYSGIDFIRMLLILAIILIGLKLNYGILSPLVAYVLVPIVLVIIFGWLLIKKVFPEFSTSNFFISLKLAKKISHFSMFIMATTVGGVILGYTDIVMLTYFSGLTSVALYSAALPTARVFLYFTRAIGDVILPLSSELWAKKEMALLKEGIESLYKYSVIIIMPAVFAMFSFSENIIRIFFGEDYVGASNALKILSIGMLFTALYGINNNFFSGIGKPQISSKIVYSAAIFNLVANFIFIPWLGIIGAAITTSAGYFIMMSIGLVSIQRFIHVEFPIRVWAKTLGAGIIFIFVIWRLKQAITLNMWLETAIILIISGVIYIALLFLLRIINIAELKDLYKRVVK